MGRIFLVSPPRKHFFADAGDIPNNPRLPLLIFKAAIPGSGEALAAAFEDLYARMIGGLHGAMASTLSLTITAPHTRCWASIAAMQ